MTTYQPLPLEEQIRKPYQPPPEYWDESIPANNKPLPPIRKGRREGTQIEKRRIFVTERVLECITKHGPGSARQIKEKLPEISRRAIRGACSDLVVSGKIVYSEGSGRTGRIYRIRNEKEGRMKIRAIQGSKQRRILDELKKEEWLTTADITLRIGGDMRSNSNIVSLLHRRHQLKRRKKLGINEYAIKDREGEINE